MLHVGAAVRIKVRHSPVEGCVLVHGRRRRRELRLELLMCLEQRAGGGGYDG